MPDERMANDMHVVGFTEFNEFICFIKKEDSLGGLQMHALHAVFCNNGVEVVLNHLDAQRISSIVVICIQGCSNQNRK